MTISERIFERLKQLSMTQREFADKAGIQQSTISEWKKNKTNPSSDKILAICKALDVSPEWLLSGVDPAENRGKNQQYYTVELSTDSGILVTEFNQLEKSQNIDTVYHKNFINMCAAVLTNGFLKGMIHKIEDL